MNRIGQRALRILSAGIYPLAAFFDMWVLYLGLSAAGIPVSAFRWWGGWAMLYGIVSLSGRRIGAGMIYAYTVHGVLVWPAAAGFAALLLLPLAGDAGRRTAGILTLSLMAAGAAAGVCGILAARRLHLRKCSITTAKVLPRKRLRIVHLSDLHFGHVQNGRFTKELVRRVNGLLPDIVCITGDFFSDAVRIPDDPEKIAVTLSGIQARYGVYGCLGNHDTADAEEMTAFFTRAGIRILSDEALFPAGNLAVIGRADATPGGIPKKRASVGECMIGTDPLQYRIVLDHQPRDIRSTAAAGADLLLCGHTHGGQFYPVRLAVRRRFPYCAGMYACGALSVSVSPGSGAGSPPIRLGSRGEIILITVRQDAECV